MNPRLFSALERHLQREIKLYEQYLALLKEERGYTTKFNASKISDLTFRRELLVEDMRLSHLDRMELCSEFSDNKGKKLISLIQANFLGEERKRLLYLAHKLRAIVNHSQKKTRDFGGVARFGLGMIEGLLSIFWSATQHVTKSYNRLGTVQENTQPAGTRDSSVLKKV